MVTGAMRIGLWLLIAGLCGTAEAQTVAVRTGGAGSQPVASAPASRPAGPVQYQPGVMIDWWKKQVLLAGEIVLREGELELFACSPNTKEHETIVRVRCRPVHVFQALGLIGLEPGKPPLYDNKTKEVVPATGQRLDINVRWTADGRTQTVPIWQWLWNKQDNRPSDPVEWVFSGSMVTKEGYLLADMDGTVITVVDFESALISVPAHHTSSNADLWLQAYTEKIPPAGTPVTVIIEAGKAQLTFRLDDMGQLYVNDQPSTLREAIQTVRQASQRPVGEDAEPAAGGRPPQAVIEYVSEASRVQAEQLALALRQVGLSDVLIRQVLADGDALASVGLPAGSATQQGPALVSLQEQGLAVLQTISDLGRQLPSAVDVLTKSLQAKYTRLNDRATAAGRAAAGAARAFEVMQGSSGQPGQPER